jgi:hypothetical protein
MANTAPTEATIRTYDVGFGDCFLLSFKYATRSRHVLIDFGTMSLPEGKTVQGPGAGKNKGKGKGKANDAYLERIARQIATDCGGKLDAVVATHRHRDHMSGFTIEGQGAKATGPGAIIRNLKPHVVIQPWTEDPKARRDAESATAAKSITRGQGLSDPQATALYMQTLHGMHHVAEHAAAAARTLRGAEFEDMRRQLTVIGDDNIKNPEAVENLRTMAPNKYVYFGSPSGLATVLPGVSTRVLGPPTIKQTRTILKQRSKDPDQFWHLNAGFWQRQALTSQRFNSETRPLFPRDIRDRVPWDARWYRYYATKERADSMFSIVRTLDAAMNNTSVILLFRIGKTLLLFPGDAQYENWMYALSQPGVLDLLKNVNVYKVGHHGSLNATPKTLWNAFKNRGPVAQRNRLATFLSTKEGPHGHRETNTEVPRRTLVAELKAKSDLTDTQGYAHGELVTAHTIPLK